MFKHGGVSLFYYWQLSHSGLSIEQNFISVAGNSASIAAMVGAELIELAPAAEVWVYPPSIATAFNSPPLPVDFSAAVAAMVRR